ncbi:MAG TPA: butyrate kinase [Firmicutes bacterium]|nr:butyrate kinase [Bacillota bacterium]
MLILAINPGSTSTKLGLYEDRQSLCTETLFHSPAELAGFRTVTDQQVLRKEAVLRFLASKNTALTALAAVVGRGGLTKPVSGGTYLINAAMLQDVREGRYGEHAANLGPVLAYEIACAAGGIPAFVVDPVVVDELDDLARVSGLPELPRESKFHALNQKAVARRAARALGQTYENVNLIVAHLGGGISIGAHRKGRVVDVNNALDGEGPMTPERSGTLPAGGLVRLCYSGRFTQAEILRKLKGQGGLMAHLGTTDAREVEARIQEGDPHAKLVFQALAYQVAKGIAALGAVFGGEVDAVVLTGGLAHSELLNGWIKERVSFLAPVMVYPGEGELDALAQGAWRVLAGEEKAKVYV